MKIIYLEGFEQLQNQPVFIADFKVSCKAIKELQEKGLIIKISIVDGTDKNDNKSPNQSGICG